jgi:16S rRNA (cytidine1402-2'-O)-methyltransferase
MNTLPNLWLQAAHHAAGLQQHPSSTLYVVATPIGNLADLSLRAIHVLSIVDVVACEDTRHTKPLLHHLGLDKPTLALHAHNENQAAQTVLEKLKLGARVAYVSDAGTPAISDPGARLVANVQQNGFRCIPIPGPSSALTALSVAGDVNAQGFVFCGFLPSRGPQRQQAMAAVMHNREAQILFEAPHRMASLFNDLASGAPERLITMGRELTKQFETVLTQPAKAWPDWVTQNTYHTKGEFVLVVHALPQREANIDTHSHDNMLAILMEELPLKQAASLAAKLTKSSRNNLYARALELKAAKQIQI